MQTSLLMLGLLSPVQNPDRELFIRDPFIDTVIYENLAVTRVRLIVENRNTKEPRELAATLFVPDDAVAFDVDVYGHLEPDTQGCFAADEAFSLYARLTDRSRQGTVTAPDPTQGGNPIARTRRTCRSGECGTRMDGSRSSGVRR